MKRFLSELQRRRVPQVAGIYLAVCWLIIEVADTTFPRLGLPDWTVTFVLVLAILGVPVVLVLAWLYDLTREGVRRTAPQPVSPPNGRGRWTAQRLALVGAALVLGLAGASWVAFSGDDLPLDEGTVAVLPFRASGELSHLREGMVDLLSTKLSGEVGPRALDPRLTLRSWRELGGGGDLVPEEAARAARRAGASHVLTGEVVAAGGSVTLSASLTRADRRRGQPIRASITGASDSVLQLVDHLAASLLGMEAGVETERLGTLTSTSLDAVVAYLEGRKAFRAGQFEEAVGHFQRALAADSTFALAALHMSGAAGWGTGGEQSRRSARLAWAYRDRLSRADRARLAAMFGPRGPAVDEPEQDRMRSIRAALEIVPDDPELWYELGDHIFHHGAWGLAARPARESRQAFERAAAIDPAFTPPIHHLIELAARDRDSAAVRRYYERYAGESGTETSGVVTPGFTAAQVLGDSALAARYERRLAEVSHGVAVYTLLSATINALPLAGLRRAFTARAEAAPTTDAEAEALQALLHLERTAGRTSRFKALLDRLPDDHAGALSEAYLYGIVLDGDSADARRRLERTVSPGDPVPLSIRLRLARQRANHDDTVGTRSIIARALGDRRVPVGADRPAHLVAPGLELAAILAVMQGGPEAPAAVARVDSFASLTPGLDETLRQTGVLLAARLWDELGEPEKAHAAARRLELEEHGVVPAAWLLQARLAARLGHRDEAIRTYRLYLDLRADAEPGTRAGDNLDAARRELRALLSAG